MTLRQRYPGRPPDFSGLAQAPFLQDWLLEPDDLSADGAVLTGIVSGHPRYPDGARLTTSTVQMLDDEEGWAWCYATGLLRLGRCIDAGYSRGIPL